MRITCAPPSAARAERVASLPASAADRGQRVAFAVEHRRAQRRAREHRGGQRGRQSRSSTSTTACGRVAGVRPGRPRARPRPRPRWRRRRRGASCCACHADRALGCDRRELARGPAPAELAAGRDLPHPRSARRAEREHGAAAVGARRRRMRGTLALAGRRPGPRRRKNSRICGENAANERASRRKRHCSLLACRPERRIPGQVSRNGGPKLLGRIPR